MTLAARLLAWYDTNRRELPWRGSTDPYEIWISEVMLQQTRVETVLPYYQRFLDRFPDVEALAAAEIDTVLASWSGLGYYRRARQLHRAAQEVVAGGAGLPATVEGLMHLPGIGAYTAAAIASIAYGVAVPVIDGNVERVLSRLEALTEDPRAASGRKRLMTLAERYLDASRPGDYNQALMELGATCCTPHNPNCGGCPLADLCNAYGTGDPEAFPALKPRAKPIREERLAVVARCDGRLLLSRRPDDERLLAGVWELPWVKVSGSDDDEASIALSRHYGGRWRLKPSDARVRHSITSRALEVAVCEGEWRPDAGDEVAEAEGLVWVDENGLEELATSSLVGKALAAMAVGER